jgi:Ca2+-binding RTX toxin-like protein
VYGTSAGDFLRGSAATSTYVHLRGLAGDDTIDGAGNIHNIVDYTDSPTKVFVDLAGATASDGFGTTDKLLNVVRVHGSNFNDTLLGGATDDAFEVTDLGAHYVDGRGGFNTVRYVSGAWHGISNIVIDLGTTSVAGGGYQGTIVKPNGVTDTLLNINGAFSDQGDDTILGSPGDDVLGGESGNNYLDGRGGYNTVNYRDYYDLQPTHGVNLNLAAGTATNPWGGHDTLVHIHGVVGTAFDDTISGGLGDDTLDGGAGTNTVIFSGLRAGFLAALSGTTLTVQDLNGTGGIDTLLNFQVFVFSDATYDRAGLLASNGAPGNGGGSTGGGTTPPTTTGTVFTFNAVADSPKAAPATIAWQAGDQIDLSHVLLTGVGHPASLHWAGVDPADQAKAYGVWEWGDGSGTLRADVDGDGMADMSFILQGAPLLAARDFVLA